MGSAALFAEVRYMNISTDPSTTYLPIIVGVSFGGK
jgi:hypothetical protein